MTPRKPLFLTLVMIVAAVFGVIGVVTSVGFLLAAGSGAGPYTLNGALVSREEFMGFAIPFLGSGTVLSVMAVFLSWALRHDRAWSRPLLLGMFAYMAAFSLVGGGLAGMPMKRLMATTMSGALLLLSLWFYLYKRDDITVYFDAIAERDRAELG